MRNAVTKYSYSLLDELAESGLAKEIGHFKTAMHTVITRAGKLESDVRHILAESKLLQPDRIDEIFKELGEKFEVILGELQVKFPAPDTAPKHKLRKKMVEYALTRAGEELIALLAKLGVSKDRLVVLQADFEKLKTHVRDIVVTIGKNGAGSKCLRADRPCRLS